MGRMPTARRIQRYASILSQDATNRIRYGQVAPRYAQRIWVTPSTVSHAVSGGSLLPPRTDSGRVRSGEWDLNSVPIDTVPKVRYSLMHWEEGTPWSETGVYEYMLGLIERRGGEVDGCRSLEDIVERYRRLDLMFEQIRQEACFRTRAQLQSRSFRERGGVLMHIDRLARPVFGRGGSHRLAAARALDLPTMPAQLGVVHPAALPRWQQLQGGLR